MKAISMKRLLGFFALATFVITATACVFDSGGDYKGGGRNPPVKKEENSSTVPTTPTTPPTTPTTPATDSAVPPPPVEASTG